MTYIQKPQISHAGLKVNKLGMSARDYEGALSTLCAGCGHDSVTAALIQAFFELNIEPHRVIKTSGIGCSSKAPAYFLRDAHGFNSLHGRMPSITTGANAANRSLLYVGISGDGDSLSIGLGQFCHAIRRNLNMLYVLENNGVYGLTKGQFSASADVGSKTKKGAANPYEPIDPVKLALALGATFVARSFSGDKHQLVPLLKAGMQHQGFAFVDIISPCVTFNDHEGSTKSYAYTREKSEPLVQTDFVPPAEAINIDYAPGDAKEVTLHSGDKLLLRKLKEDYDPTNIDRAISRVAHHQKQGEVVTGLIYIQQNHPEMHDFLQTVAQPLIDVPYDELCPGSAALDDINKRYL